MAEDTNTGITVSSSTSDTNAQRLSTRRLDVYEHIGVLFVKHTLKTFLGCWSIMIIFAIVAIAVRYLRIDPVGFEDWLVLGTSAVENYDKLKAAIDYVELTESSFLPERSQEAGRFFSFQYMFRWDNPEDSRDYLIPKNLQDICLIEGALLNHPEYNLYCLASISGADGPNTVCDPPRLSLSTVFYNNEIKRKTCELLTQAEIDAVRLPLYALLNTPDEDLTPSELGNKAVIRFMIGASFVQTGNATSFRSLIQLGAPLPGFNRLVQNSKEPQFDKFSEFLLKVESDMFKLLNMTTALFAPPYHVGPDGYVLINREPEEDRTKVRWFNFALQNEQYRTLVNDDQLLAAASVIIVGSFMYVHVKSLWITAMGLMGILISVPMCAFFYSGVLGIKYFTQIHVIIIFIIIGIGTDNVFVFVDAWKQSAEHYKRVRGVQSLEDAGRRNYYGTGVAISEMEIARMAYTWQRSMEAILATSFTTAVAFLATAISPIVPIAGFGYYAAIVVVANYVIVLTMMPGMVLIYSRYLINRTVLQLIGCRPGPTKAEIDAMIGSETSVDTKVSPEDRLFRKFYLPMMLWKRKIIPLLCLIGLCGQFAIMTVFAVRLNTPVKEEPQFRPNHMFTNYDEAFMEFTNGTAGIDEKNNYAEFNFVFGVTGIERPKFDFWVPAENRGDAVFNPNFKFSLPSSQEFFLRVCDLAELVPCDYEVCDGAHPNKVMFNPLFIECWFRDFQAFVQTTQNVSTVDLYYDGTFNSTLKAWMQMPSQGRLKNKVIGFIEGTDAVRFVVLPMYSTMKAGRPVNIKSPVLEIARTFSQNLSLECPNEMDDVFYSSFDDLWMQTELGIVSGMISGLAITFPVCFAVLLLSTGNLVISIFAILSIGGVVCTVLGIIQLMGWALGIGEAIANVMVVGLAVDYTVHLGGAYRHASKFGINERQERFVFAVNAMAGTVFASAVTTIASTIPLFVANLAFFYKMATLLSLTIGFSAVFTYFFFMPLLLFLGPAGDFADIYALIRRISCCKRGETRSEQVPEGASTTEKVNDFVNPTIMGTADLQLS